MALPAIWSAGDSSCNCSGRDAWSCRPRGNCVETRIFKIPVSGPIVVGKLNLQGDGQADLANHGGSDKAVYLYSWDNIVHWKRALQRDDLGPGALAENSRGGQVTKRRCVAPDGRRCGEGYDLKR
jgi:hypothetical protein